MGSTAAPRLRARGKGWSPQAPAPACPPAVSRLRARGKGWSPPAPAPACPLAAAEATEGKREEVLEEVMAETCEHRRPALADGAMARRRADEEPWRRDEEIREERATGGGGDSRMR